MIFASLLSAFVAAQSLSAPKPASYHDRLLALCESRAGQACCRASARQMRKEQARLYNKETGCPKGTLHTSLPCPASFSWCTREQKEYRDPFND